MKSIHRVVPLFIALAVTAATAHGQSVVTDPVGFITVSAKAGSTTTPVTTFIALSMARPAVYQSLVPSTGGASTVNGVTVITFPANTFTAGQFGPGAGSLPNFYVEILNGTNAGILSEITATATGSITLADNVTSVITNGTTTFRIRPHWTFGAAFGAANETGLLSGSTPAAADIVNIINPLTGAATGYFFNSASGHARWEKTTDNSDATNVPISPESGLQLARKGTTDLTFKLAGAVKTGPTALYVSGSTTADTYNLVGNPYALDSVMLKDSRLYTGDAATGVAGGTSAAAADIVRIYDYAHNQYNDYFFNNGSTENRWKTGTTDASLTVIPPGAGIAIIRRANRPAFDWYAPQPAMVLGDTPLELTMKSAVSRKTHNTFGDVDVNLPLTGSVGIEPRTSATAGAYSVYINYSGASSSNPITIASNTVTVTHGTATVASQVVENGNTIRVELTGVTNAQTVTLGVGAVSASNGKSAPSGAVNFGLFVGDVNNSRSITGTDVNLVNAQVGLVTKLSNFREDTNRSGTYSGTDVNLTKSNVGLTYIP